MPNLRRVLGLLALCVCLLADAAHADTYVRGYFRSNGTYVQPHMRPSPDGNPYNNFSYPGNVNPYTGKVAPGNPDTYLQRYYGGASSSVAPPGVRDLSVQARIRKGLTLQSGPSLSSAQLALSLHGYEVGPIDGRYGTNTTRALRQFQRSHQLDPTGMLDAGTAVALLDSLRELEPNAASRGIQKKGGFRVTHDGATIEGCPRGYLENATGCAAISIPDNAALNYIGNGWDCLRGFRSTGSACMEVRVPANGRLDYLGHSWECDRGYRQVAGACVLVEIPRNGHLDYLGHGWECERGFRQLGQSCAAVTVPANGRLDYLGHGWECERGFAQAGSSCQPVRLPANARLDYLGHSWECARGYQQDGETCAEVRVPLNAHLDYLGHGWECDQGYRRSNGRCLVQ